MRKKYPRIICKTSNKKFSSVLNIFPVGLLEEGGVDADLPNWHSVGARNALVTRGLMTMPNYFENLMKSKQTTNIRLST